MAAKSNPTPKQQIDEFLKQAKREPFGILAKVIEFNDAWAREILSRNRNNRKVSRANVRRYQDDLANGRWVLNGQTIVISSDGILADGQHRAEPFVGTPYSAPILMVFGTDPATRVTMDQGRARTAGDSITMLGEDTGDIVGTMIRYLLAYETNGAEDLRGLAKASRARILEYFGEHQARVRKSAEFARELRDVARYHVAAPMLAFLHYILSETEPTKAETYLRQIAKGEGLTEDDPAYVVRSKLIALGRVNGTKKAEVILSGWKPFLEGKPMKGIRIQGRLPGI